MRRTPVTPTRLGAVAVAGVVTSYALAGTAVAVQTDTFGLKATGNRTAIVVPAGGSPVVDSVEVYNRTAKTLPVTLDVVGADRRGDGTFHYGASGQGLASKVTLSTTQLTLDPHATSVVTVRIDRPGHVGADQWAAITAVTNDAGASGVDVVQRLALFVGVTSRGSTASANEGDDTARLVAIAVAAALVAIGAGALLTRRRAEAT